MKTVFKHMNDKFQLVLHKDEYRECLRVLPRTQPPPWPSSRDDYYDYLSEVDWRDLYSFDKVVGDLFWCWLKNPSDDKGQAIWDRLIEREIIW